MICSKCDGKGVLFTEEIGEANSIKTTVKNVVICPKCLGTCKVNWIENIVGKKEEDIFPPKRAKLGDMWEHPISGVTFTYSKHGWYTIKGYDDD